MTPCEFPPRGGRPRALLLDVIGPDGAVEARHPEDHYIVRQLLECMRRGHAAGWRLRPVTEWNATGRWPMLVAPPGVPA
jgi:hypothetical protein